MKNPVRQKLDSGELILCSMLRLPDPSSAEMLAQSGIDMLCIDNEHYGFNAQTIENMTRAVQIHGATVFVRIPNDDPAMISQMLDCGVAGIKIPHVETKKQAQDIVEAVKYAPLGKRGFCPITRSASYGLRLAPSDYTVEANKETLIALMIETRTGLENLDEILSVEGVDMIAIGPSDVSASYGHPGQPDHPKVKEAIEKARQKIFAKGGHLIALVKNEEDALRELEAGTRIFQIGSELQMLAGGFSALVKEVRAAVSADLMNEEN